MSIDTVPVESAGAIRSGRQPATPRDCCASSCARRRSWSALRSCCSGSSARSSATARRRTTRYAQNLNAINQAPSGAHWFGTDQLGRDMFSRVIVGAARHPDVAPLATLLGTVARHRARAGHGLLPRGRRRRRQPLRRGVAGAPAGRHRRSSARSRSAPRTGPLIVVIGVVFTPLIARTVRAAVLLERELDYVAAARLRGEGAAVHHVRRDPAERAARRSWSSRRSASATPSSRSPR